MLATNIDPALWNKIMRLNDELLVLSELLAVELGKLVIQDVELQVALKKLKVDLQEPIRLLKMTEIPLVCIKPLLLLLVLNKKTLLFYKE